MKAIHQKAELLKYWMRFENERYNSVRTKVNTLGFEMRTRRT